MHARSTRPARRSTISRRVLLPLLVAGAVVAASTAVSATPVAAEPGEQSTATCASIGRSSHVVEAGDTWFGIAATAGASMSSLAAANGVTVDEVLHPGDVVCLPDGARSASGCSVSNASTHTVAVGDTWWDIARSAGVSMRSLLDANGAPEDRIIHPGERVCLPAGARTGSRATEPAHPVTASTDRAAGLAALPMQGPCWFGDSWGEPRGTGRRHEGVDLFAAPRSHVYAVVDGTLTRRAWDQPGRRAGNAWWLTAADGSGTYYFYAHLDDFAPGLSVGDRVQAGEIIGFMGNTGNSAFPHLHFEIHPQGGAAVNPYPTVRAAGGCKSGPGYRQPSGWVPT